MYYEIHGNKHNYSETVLMSSGLGGSHGYWEHQLPLLSSHFRVIVYDHVATGKSQGVLSENYSVADMADEVVALMSETDTEKVHFIGHALGGLIGLQLAIEFPQKISSLFLVNAWDKTDEHTIDCFEIRKFLLLNAGIDMYLKAQPLFLYPAEWIKQHRTKLNEDMEKAITTFSGVDNLIKRIEAIANFDISNQLGKINCPTAIVGSKDDLLVPYSCSEQLNQKIKNSSFYSLEKGGHACNVTESDDFNEILKNFYFEKKGKLA